jgi:hypothetical protein
MRLLVPRFDVYLVRLLGGGHLLPRAKVLLNLGGTVSDTPQVPGLDKLLTRELTLDLFKPPQRERIRGEVVRLSALGLNQRQIAAALAERPKLPAVQRALALHRKMQELGLASPYVPILTPPEDYAKLRRHRNPKYSYQPLDDYQRPAL